MPTDTPLTTNDLFSGALDCAVPQSNQFFREQLAEAELTEEALKISEQVIDYASAVIVTLNAVRPERRVRDLITAALLRRAAITGEAICVLLRHGLAEPAFATHRTLLDVEIALKLVLRDNDDIQARRLALACVLQYKAHGQDMLTNRVVREQRLRPANRLNEIMAVTKTYADLVKDPTFDAVRDAVAADTHWHGFQNIEEALTSLGQTSDYYMTYDAASWFVHGVNVEHDLSASNGDQPALRPFVERDPSQIRAIMGLALLKLLELVALFVEDRKADIDQLLGGNGKMRFDDGTERDIGSFMALTTLVMREFDVRENAPFRRPAA